MGIYLTSFTHTGNSPLVSPPPVKNSAPSFTVGAACNEEECDVFIRQSQFLRNAWLGSVDLSRAIAGRCGIISRYDSTRWPLRFFSLPSPLSRAFYEPLRINPESAHYGEIISSSFFLVVIIDSVDYMFVTC